jgi:hypothetical protein
VIPLQAHPSGVLHVKSLLMHVSPHAFPTVHTLQQLPGGVGVGVGVGVGLGVGADTFRMKISAVTAPFTLTVRSAN